jgi:hypothetical protein
MENTLELQNELFTQIEAELEFCDETATPLVCSNYSNPNTKLQLVKTIAETAIKGTMSIAQAIVEVERLYSPNDID